MSEEGAIARGNDDDMEWISKRLRMGHWRTAANAVRNG
jgi:hypothetical protein